MGVISWIFILLGVLIAIPLLRAAINMFISVPFGEEKTTFLDWIRLIGLLALMGAGGVLFEEDSWWAPLPMIILIAILYDWYGQLKRFFQRRRLHQENLKREANIKRGKKFLKELRKAPYNNDKVGQSFIKKTSSKPKTVKDTSNLKPGGKFYELFKDVPFNTDLAGKSFIRKVSKKK